VQSKQQARNGRRVVAAVGTIAIAATLALIGSAGAARPVAAVVPAANGMIAFGRYDPALDDDRTWVMHSDGSNLHQLFPEFSSGGPHWSPDGTQVAVNSGLGGSCDTFCSGNTVIVTAATGAYRVITPAGPPAVGVFCTIWSPDATHFLCEGGNDNDASVNGVYTVRASDGGDLVRLTNAGGMRDLPIDFSPDGTKFVFSRSEGDNCGGKAALYVANVDGTQVQRITPWGFCDNTGSWSPDGTRIAFVRNDGFIFTVRPDGTALAKLALATDSRSYAGDVAWSPDGSKIVFLLTVPTASHGYSSGIATANSDGTNVQFLTTTPTFDHDAAWGAGAR